MVLKKNSPKQGEIWLFDPDPVRGTEIGKKVRPALIISCNVLNAGPAGLSIIVPITSKEKGILSHVRIDPPEGGIFITSFIMCEQIRAVSKERLIKKIGQIQDLHKLHEVNDWISDLLWIES